jgi:RNA polymerase sigma-70 factor (ECF subfamily)
VIERFLAVLNSGDIQDLLDLLAPDVVLVADGGGQVAAARHPLEGADRVAAFLSGFERIAPVAEVKIVWLNGAPAVRIDLEGELDTALSLVIEDGRISRIYAVRNPDKLARLGEETRLSRTS